MKKGNNTKSLISRKRKNLAVLFDMDGVLVDVSESYRRTIQKTVKVFSKVIVQPKEIQVLKEKGGYNNDWDLTEAILVSRGISVPKVEIIRIFQEFYLGAKGTKGLIENECWLLEIETLRELRKVYYTGIVTGRPREETLYVLKKFGTELLFDVVVSMEDYPMEKSKPDPYPIELALERLGGYGAIYVGDSVDDIKAAVRAGVRAFGCIPPGVQSANALRELLTKTGAERVLFDVNEILDVLPLKNNTRASCY